MNCRICLQNDFSEVIDFKNQPIALHFLKKEEIGKEPYYPLKLIYCNRCGCVQLNHTVKKEMMYSDHTYLSGMTKTLQNHFSKLAKDVDKRFFPLKKEKKALDIGSNDGTQLKYYKDLGYEVLGVEPSKTISDIANERGIFTLPKFFNLDCIKKINKKFDVINASGVFFHLEELHSVTEAIKVGLEEDGVFVVQAMYMKNILENVAFDQIYHEHLLYYTIQTLNALLNMHNLELFDAYIDPIHGGSIIGFATHKNKKEKTERLQSLIYEEEHSKCNHFSAYENFSKNIEKLKMENLSFLEKCKKEKKVVYAMGAPVKGNTLLNYFDIDKSLIQALIEKNELRKNLYSPGKHIPILIEKELDHHPDVYYVLAWNFKKEILKNNQGLIKKGVIFYFPHTGENI